MFPRRKTPDTAAPSRHNRKLAQRAYKYLSRVVADANVGLITTDLERVQFYPSHQLSQLQSDIYRQYGYVTNPDRPTPRSSVRLAKTAGAGALYHGSAMSLEYRAHRFIFTSDEPGLKYHRTPFDINCQSYGSQVLDLVGLGAVASHEAALEELDWLAHDLRNVRPNNWESSRQTAHTHLQKNA